LEFSVADAGTTRQKIEKTEFVQVTIILYKWAVKRRILTEFLYEFPIKVGWDDRIVILGTLMNLLNNYYLGYYFY
jgi:hypothetical protein